MRIHLISFLAFLCLLAGMPLSASQPAKGSALDIPAEPSAGQPEPLPDPEFFLQEVRRRLQTDEERQSGYAYIETRREHKLDSSGEPIEQSVKVFESYPGLPGERRWRRLIEEDGTRVPAAELERQDRERRERVAEYTRARAEGGPGQEGKAEPRGRNEERLEDAFRVFSFQLIGRERLNGHDTVVFSLTPRPNAPAKTREGKLLRYFHGRAWISETDYELVRLEAEAIDNVSIGWGLVGRIHKGSKLSFERHKVDEHMWLPARTTYSASARVLLVRRIRMGGITEFSGYRKIGANTAAASLSPPPPE